MAQPPFPQFQTQEELADQLRQFPALTAKDRLRAQLNDVGFLRHWWKNFGEVAPEVYRSNHPGRRRLAGYADMGIKAVLNLRGTLDRAPQRLEAAACAEFGMEFHSLGFSARQAPRREALQELFHKFDTLPRPFLMHCKSGADRAGLASVLYLLDQEGADMATARGELSFKYLHIKHSETGILDFFLDAYAARHAETQVSVRDWVAEEYDRDNMIARYEASKT